MLPQQEAALSLPYLRPVGTIYSRNLLYLTNKGGFFGAFDVGFCDLLTRGGALLLGSALFMISGILQTAAENVFILYISCLFAGFGIRILIEIVPQF
ncbi:hypothetical protein F5884DRAFT_794891 [Xylogone sp. PMI_703]|nr:hypothetical protein F5884DRAFT_794891 [Xylogone sp. PMI_703]